MLISKIRKKTRYIIWGFAGIFIASIFYMFGMDTFGGAGKNANRQRSNVPNEMLIVDGREIERTQFFHKYMQFKMQAEQYERGSFDSYPMKMYLQSVVADYFVNQELYLQEAKRRSLGADSAEVSKRMNMYMDMLVGPVKETTKDPSVQGRAKNFFSQKEREKQFRDTLVRQGITYDFLKTSIRRDVIEEKVQQELGKDRMTAEKKKAREKADSIIEKLQTGEPFDNLAREFSEDESTKYSGGDLSWIKHGTLIPEFEKIAFSMQPGQMTQPVETPMGLHIILCVNKIEAAGPEFEEEKPKIVQRIRDGKEDETAEVTDEEIRNEYEQVHVKHILIKVKSDRELAQEWVKEERGKSTHKIEIINPELKAYKYISRSMMNPTAGEPDYDEALKLYRKAIDTDPKNPYLYYQVGTIYERKNMKAKFASMMGEPGEAAPDTDEADPYAEAMAEASDNVETTPETDDSESPLSDVDPDDGAEAATGAVAVEPEAPEVGDKIFLQEALEAYDKAARISEDEYRYDALIFIAAGRTAKELGKDALAIERLVTAVEYAPGQEAYLTQIIEALEGYEQDAAVEALAEAEEVLEEIRAAEAADIPDDAMQFTVDEAGDGEASDGEAALEEDSDTDREEPAPEPKPVPVKVEETKKETAPMDEMDVMSPMQPIEETPADNTMDPVGVKTP